MAVVNPLGTIATLAPTASKELGLFNIDNVRTMALTVRGTTNSGATGPIRIKLRFSPDGTNWDTVDYTYFDLDVSAGSATQETHLIDCPETGYMTVIVTNTDTAKTASNIIVWVRVVRWSDDISNCDEE